MWISSKLYNKCTCFIKLLFSQVFDVTLNRVHTIVSDLDIFAKVGKGVAHDEHIPFTVKGNKLIVNDEESEHDGKIRVDFIKVSYLLDEMLVCYQSCFIRKP